MGELVLGVDGGNTKTVALAATPTGAIVGSGRGGCADIYGATTMAAAIGEIGNAVRSALPEGASGDEVTHASFSLAGADWPEDKEELRRALSPLVPSADVLVVNDAIGALRAGTPDGVGVAVVLGTGGCIGSGGPDGRQWHSSWWGLNLGAWWIGGEALQAVYAAELGTRPPTALTEAALALYGDATVEDLLHAFHRRDGRHPWEASRFAPDVLHLALSGDAAALGVVVGHGVKLGEIAHVAAEKVGLEAPFPLALLGGVFRGEGSSLILDEIVARVPGGVVVRTSREPAVGALLLSLDRTGVDYELATVDATVPGDDLFHTHPRP